MVDAVGALREIADRFDVFIIDQWGVLHDGRRCFAPAVAALQTLSERGKRVVLLSNTALDSQASGERLAGLGIGPHLYSHLITSGDHFVAWWKADVGGRQRRFGAAYLLARPPRFTMPVCEGLSFTSDIGAAGCCIVAGIDFARWAASDYDRELALARARALPMLCINPDEAIPGPLGLHPGPGLIARRYAERGGGVRWFGKPDPDIFRLCLDGVPLEARDAVLVIGDSLRTDMLGASRSGLAGLLIGSGVHRPQLNAADWPRALGELCRSTGIMPQFAMPELVW